ALERAGKRARIRTADGSGVATATQPANAAPGAAPVAAGPAEPDIVIGSAGGQQVASKQIALGNMNGRPVILVAPDAGAQAAGLFSNIWQQAAGGTTLTVNAVEQPGNNDSNAVSLQYLGAKPSSFDVLAHADWNASFDIGSVAADGKGPGTLVIDVAGSPSAARTPPVVSVFLNDVLLGAKEMEANGKRERIVAPIPRYALQTRNVIRVSFVRQLASDRCRETPEAYPVSVLASSHMLLDKIDPSSDFTGLMAKFASGGTLLVPQAHLSDATTTLPRVIRLAASTGLSPTKAKFQTVANGASPKVEGAFLAVDVVPDGVAGTVKPEQDRLYLAGSKDRPLLDVRGLNRVGMLEVVGKGDNVGAVYRTLGPQAPSMEKPIMLSGGNLAIMGNNGLRTEVNTHDPSGQGVMKEAAPGLFERGYWWLMPIVLVALFIALLVFASRMRRRRDASGDR
ncbi:MAG: cellulose synthase, partial [Ramlibacter sp.]|nr:cellulose synthase [Ramlibacter sp.]